MINNIYMNLEKELKKLESKKNKLEKKNIDLIITDFDDTIFCRKEQLESDENLVKNRWEKWNDYIKNVVWIEKFVDKYYLGKDFPQSIVNKLRLWHDLILTAWMEEFSSAKINAIGLDIYNFIVVEQADMKIIETIKYVVNTLRFIPSKIVVYEDRPKFFIENKNLIENFLWTKLEIMLVEMIDNETEPMIKKID